LVVFFTLSSLTKSHANQAPVFEFQSNHKGVFAELDYQGDYFYHPSGREIRFYRKKDVYAIKGKSSRQKSAKVNHYSQLKRVFGDRVKDLKSHRLGSMQLIRVKNPNKNNQEQNRKIGDYLKVLGDIDQFSISSAVTNQAEVLPVLANSKGSGDILLGNGVIFKFQQNGFTPQILRNLENKYKLRYGKKLRVPGQVYSFALQRRLTTGEQFALVRNLSRQTVIEWAQPQFITKPVKHSYQPLDPLYSQQWHLQNTGYQGSLCDSDCDASNGWDKDNANGFGAVSGAGMVVAVIDDGVQLDHEDLVIWNNPQETGFDGMSEVDRNANGLDDDGNGYIDDWRGWDFVDDSATQLKDPNSILDDCPNASDGTSGPDNDPSPQPETACVTVSGDDVEQDNHGTAVAGIAAASEGNSLGGVGVAFSAQVLPIRLISEFDGDPSEDFCERAAEAIIYAGRYADVLNNSWGMEDDTCFAVEDAVDDVVDGNIMLDLTDDMVSNPTNEAKRPGLGSPTVFAAGNNASGWVKVTVPVSAGNHAFEWRFLRSDFPDDFESIPVEISDFDKVWLDDVTFPGGEIVDFESGLGDFATSCEENTCITDEFGQVCEGISGIGGWVCPLWQLDTSGNFAVSGSNSATVDMTGSDCSYSYLHLEKTISSGELSFWVWVGTDQQVGSDKFEFLIDGEEIISYGDIPRLNDDAVSFPANVDKAIAVGASNSGDLSGESGFSLTNAERLALEERAFYSQYGEFLDVLAPSSGQHLGVTTTDRYGLNASGYDSSSNYFSGFGGTSASAPIVAGIAAAMIASGPDYNGSSMPITALQVEQLLRSTADKIGKLGSPAYDQDGGQRSLFYGYGRVNMYQALNAVSADTVSGNLASETCQASPTFTYTASSDLFLGALAPQPTESCPALGPIAAQEELCIPIKAQNNRIAVICL